MYSPLPTAAEDTSLPRGTSLRTGRQKQTVNNWHMLFTFRNNDCIWPVFRLIENRAPLGGQGWLLVTRLILSILTILPTEFRLVYKILVLDTYARVAQWREKGSFTVHRLSASNGYLNIVCHGFLLFLWVVLEVLVGGGVWRGDSGEVVTRRDCNQDWL